MAVADINLATVTEQADQGSFQAVGPMNHPELFLRDVVEGLREPEERNEEDQAVASSALAAAMINSVALSSPNFPVFTTRSYMVVSAGSIL